MSRQLKLEFLWEVPREATEAHKLSLVTEQIGGL